MWDARRNRRPPFLVVAALGLACAGGAWGAGCAIAHRTADAPSPLPVSVQRDVVYAQRTGQDLRADVYTPLGQGPFPGVLVVHGGSWRRGNKERMARVAERLAQRGYVAVSIDYRLAPAYRYPAQLYDCKDAVRWMRRNAGALRIDSQHIAGFGYSAGAHLVALLATTDATNGLDGAPDAAAVDTRLQAAVVGAAPTDLRRFRPNPIFRNFLGGSAAELPELYAAASPITFVTTDDPPMFLYHGADDWMVDVSQSQRMMDALHRAGVPVQFYETNGGHFTTFLFDGESVRRAIDFLDEWLKPDAPRALQVVSTNDAAARLPAPPEPLRALP